MAGLFFNMCSWALLQKESWGDGKFRHNRLANLIGYCCDGYEKLLVAELMPTDTLAKNLFHRNTLYKFPLE